MSEGDIPLQRTAQSTLRNSAVYRRESLAQGFSLALGAAVCAILLYLVYLLLGAAASVATPFIVGIAFALLLEPLVARVGSILPRQISIAGRSLKVPRGVAVGLTFLIFLLGFGGLLGFVVPNVVTQGSDVARKFPAYFDSVRDKADAWLAGQGVVANAPAVDFDHPEETIALFSQIPLSPEALDAQMGTMPTGGTNGLVGTGRNLFGYALPPDTASLLKQYSSQISTALRATGERVLGALTGGVGTIVSLAFAPLVTLYVLGDISRMRARFFYILPFRVRRDAQRHAAATGVVFGNYIRGMLTICAIYAVVATVLIFGESMVFPGLRQHAILIGVVCGLFYAVPVLGPGVMVTFTALVTLATGNPIWGVVAAVSTVFAMNFIFDNLLMPRLVGGSVGLHPLVSLFSLLLGGQFLGVVGMLISIPVAASIQLILYQLFPRLTAPLPISYFLSEEAREKHRESHAKDEEEDGGMVDESPAYVPAGQKSTASRSDAPDL